MAERVRIVPFKPIRSLSSHYEPAVGLVGEDLDVLPQVQIRRHVKELVDHRHDDASVVVAQELV